MLETRHELLEVEARAEVDPPKAGILLVFIDGVGDIPILPVEEDLLYPIERLDIVSVSIVVEAQVIGKVLRIGGADVPLVVEGQLPTKLRIGEYEEGRRETDILEEALL